MFLHTAIRTGNMRILKYFVEKDCIDVNKRLLWIGTTPLVYASVCGRLGMVKYLWKKGADIHADNNNAIIYASYNDHLELIKFLWEKGADITCITQKQRSYCFFTKKIEMKRRVEAANKIAKWWIPICYDTTRECGKRMMERGWREIQKI